MASTNIEHGNFTELAVDYRHRPGYCQRLLQALLAVHGKPLNQVKVADIGAGTGKLTKQLCQLGVASIIAVEPNDAMRNQGVSYTSDLAVEWRPGSGENTTLPDASVDWVLMGSAFHWVNLKQGLAEFHRILSPGGMFTAVWNPRDLQRSALQAKIDAQVKEMVPGLKRVSSGGSSTQDWFTLLVSTGEFGDPLFMEAKHEEVMSPERYMGVWNSVNDMQVQAGPERWQQILKMIEHEIAELDEVIVPYSTRAWTVWRTDSTGK